MDIFKEKIPGTDRYLVSAELIAYLKWLIYVAAFKDRGNVAHELYYNTEVAYLNSAGAQWRKDLYDQLVEWYEKHPPGKKRGRVSDGGASAGIGAFGRQYKCVDANEFIDPFKDDEAPAARPRPGGAGGSGGGPA